VLPPYDNILNPAASERSYSSSGGVGVLNGSPSWSPASCAGLSGTCWMQMDLGAERRVSGVVTQDDTWYGRYVATFFVRACAQANVNGTTCASWSDVDGGAAFQGPSHGCGPPIGNCAGNGLTGMGVPVDALFSSYIEARLIRIYPLTNVRGWYMRAAVLVVDYPPPPPSPPSPPVPPPALPAPPLPPAPPGTPGSGDAWISPVTDQAFYSLTMTSEWSLTFDIKPQITTYSYFANILHIRGLSATERFPAVYFRSNRRKINVQYGPSSYKEVNQISNMWSGQICSVDITLRAGILTLSVDGAVQGSTSVGSVCSSGCGGTSKTLYFCSPTSNSYNCANTQIRNLRFTSV